MGERRSGSVPAFLRAPPIRAPGVSPKSSFCKQLRLVRKKTAERILSGAPVVVVRGDTMSTTSKAEKTTSTFRMGYSIRGEIQAPPEKIWALLTDAKRFPEWNSTVTSIGGE